MPQCSRHEPSLTRLWAYITQILPATTLRIKGAFPQVKAPRGHPARAWPGQCGIGHNRELRGLGNLGRLPPRNVKRGRQVLLEVDGIDVFYGAIQALRGV